MPKRASYQQGVFFKDQTSWDIKLVDEGFDGWGEGHTGCLYAGADKYFNMKAITTIDVDIKTGFTGNGNNNAPWYSLWLDPMCGWTKVDASGETDLVEAHVGNDSGGKEASTNFGGCEHDYCHQQAWDGADADSLNHHVTLYHIPKDDNDLGIVVVANCPIDKVVDGQCPKPAENCWQTKSCPFYDLTPKEPVSGSNLLTCTGEYLLVLDMWGARNSGFWISAENLKFNGKDSLP